MSERIDKVTLDIEIIEEWYDKLDDGVASSDDGPIEEVKNDLLSLLDTARRAAK